MTFMASQTGKQISTISILPNMSRSKGNQAMQFGQLKECKMRNMRNIFLKNHIQNVLGKLVSQKNEHISGSRA